MEGQAREEEGRAFRDQGPCMRGKLTSPGFFPQICNLSLLTFDETHCGHFTEPLAGARQERKATEATDRPGNAAGGDAADVTTKGHVGPWVGSWGRKKAFGQETRV